jgi:competence protein ComEC
MIASHPHSDHIGGLTELVKKMPVKKLIMPSVPKKLVPNNGMYRDFLAALESEQIPVEICDGPQTVDLGGASLAIIGPFLEDPGNLNDCSLAVRVDARDASFLLMGDCEAPAEKALMASGTDLDTDILLAGHHGSDTSSTPAFLLAVTPMASAVSVGEGNSYGLPDKSIIARLLRFGPVYRTDQQGGIVFSTDGETISVSAGPDAAQEFSAAA